MSIGDWPDRVLARLRSLWHGARHRDAVEAEMVAEFRHHIELRAADLVRAGLTREQAERRARLEFGHIESHRLDARKARGLRRFDQLRFSALDVRLGVRMLGRYPGLSLIAVLGMALAVAIGSVVFSIMTAMTSTSLPLPGGERIVALRNTMLADPSRHTASLRDLGAWEALESVEDVAAFSTVGRNLLAPGVPIDVVPVVRMTASGFDLAGTRALRGRTLTEEDARRDARVVVIAFDEWQTRYAADPNIVGRRIRLGRDEYTIVGVMPEGFHFPVDDRYWIPLVFAPAERAHEDAVSLAIAGRLATGATLEGARAELAAIGARMAALYPDTHEGLRPQVLPWARAFFDMDGPEAVRTARLFQFMISLLLVVVAANVAILIYARTATRMGEIAVRSALGASRTRVVTQLFAEALVLSGAAALMGLAIAGFALSQLETAASQRLGAIPFWVDLGLSPGVVLYAVALAVVGAAITGVLPALKATGRRIHTSLQQLAGRGIRLQLGRAWTALIVAQVAVAVAVLPFAVHLTEELIGAAEAEHPGYPIEHLLRASLAFEPTDAMPQDTGFAGTRFRARAAELLRRVEGHAAVAGVAVRGPGSRERVQVEGAGIPGAGPAPMRSGTERIERVDPNYFAVLGIPLLAGRGFASADARDGSVSIIANQVFAEEAGGNRPIVGRRVRFVQESEDGGVEPGPWLVIVGVVRDFDSYAYEPHGRLYLATDVSLLSPPVDVTIRVKASPAVSFGPELRRLAAAADPALQLTAVMGAAEAKRESQRFARYFAGGATAVMLSVLLLSAAGIYALMSFTVTRRRREIGIRSALGAQPQRLLASIFARASAQVGAGMVLGLIGTMMLEQMANKGPIRDGNALVLAVVAASMAIVGLLAAIGPARRGLAVQPTEALREE